jgi:hypothetical protein
MRGTSTTTLTMLGTGSSGFRFAKLGFTRQVMKVINRALRTEQKNRLAHLKQERMGISHALHGGRKIQTRKGCRRISPRTGKETNASKWFEVH